MTQHHAPLSMSEHVRDDRVLVRLGGRLDRRSAPDVRIALLRAISDSGRPVLLDLGEAVLGDATALGLLVELRRLALRSGVELRVVAADERTVRLLHRVRLQALLAPMPAASSSAAGAFAEVV